MKKSEALSMLKEWQQRLSVSIPQNGAFKLTEYDLVLLLDLLVAALGEE